MFRTTLNLVGTKTDSLEFKHMVFIVLVVIGLVILSLILDSIRRVIRGLDITALGALFLWAGYEAAGMDVVDVISGILLLVGGTLVVSGLIVFVMIKVYRHKRNVRLKEQMEQERLQEERLQKAREAEAKAIAEAEAAAAAEGNKEGEV